MSRQPRICFMAFNLYPLVKGEACDCYGGAEVQQYHLIKSLKGRYEPVVVSGDCGRRRTEYLDGITFIGGYPRWSGKLKYRHIMHTLAPEAMSLMEKMAFADADLYFQRVGNSTVGVAALYARTEGKPYVFSVAIDDDIALKRRSYLERKSILYGLRHASAVVVQTLSQKEMLSGIHGIEGYHIPSMWPAEKRPEPWKGEPHVLWVGRFNEVKNYSAVIELARRLPDIKFVVAGGSSFNRKGVEEMKAAPQILDNLEYKGWLPFRECSRLYEGAIVINTSFEEGFPNTFLQAWSCGSPVVSLHIDPDGILSEKGTGISAQGDMDTMAGALRELHDNPDRAQSIGMKGWHYLSEEHSPEKVINLYSRLFEELGVSASV